MLARHLLFFAARRPHSALLAVPKESVSQDGSFQKPPPYVEPPQLKNHRQDNIINNQKSNLSSYVKPHQQQQQNNPVVYRNESNSCTADNENRTNYENRMNYKENHHHQHHHNRRYHHQQQQQQHEVRSTNNLNTEEVYNDRQILRSCSNNDETIFDRRKNDRNIRNSNNDYNIYSQQTRSSDNSNQQFYTLPSYKTQREIEPPRSVTPDITRGLARGPLSSIHIMARGGKNFTNQNHSGANKSVSSNNEHPATKNITRSLIGDNKDHRQMQTQNQEQSSSSSSSVLRNRFIVPASLAAVGYRFVAAAPAPAPAPPSSSTTAHSSRDLKSPIPGSDALKRTALSPIAPSSNKAFQSSTPGGVMKSGSSTHTANSSSGRNTPTNLILSPTKSTMSNEELFAAIHKSKRRLNIREDNNDGFPTSNEHPIPSLEQNQVSTRHSWSPESQKTPVIPKSAAPLSATSRLDFKRLLLQQSVKTGPTKLSAAEQLKLSRQNSQQQQQQILFNQENYNNEISGQLKIPQPITPVKVLSPRAAWRFQSPRSDVLSSTIIEDSAAEEKAMKPSPENPSPISRINYSTKRQLDLRSDLSNDADNKIRDISITGDNGENNSNFYRVKANDVPNYSSIKKDCNLIQQETDLHRRNHHRFMENEYSGDVNKTVFNIPKINSPSSSRTVIEAGDNSRRINNQIARAQFLASVPATNVTPNTLSEQNNKGSYFIRHNRARSESPNHGIPQNVTRSPSAPTLETAL